MKRRNYRLRDVDAYITSRELMLRSAHLKEHWQRTSYAQALNLIDPVRSTVSGINANTSKKYGIAFIYHRRDRKDRGSIYTQIQGCTSWPK